MDTETTAPFQTTNSAQTTNPEVTVQGKSKAYYFVLAVIVVCVLYLLYSVYKKFVSNQESFIKGNEQERTDTVVDFNLTAAIKELENLQNNILSKISNVMG